MMATAARTFSYVRLPADDHSLDVGEVVKTFVVVAGGLCALAISLPTTIALVIAVPLLAAWFWRGPVRGVYLLTAGAGLIEIFPLNFSDSVTDRVLLFLNLNNWGELYGIGGLTPFKFNPAEIVIIVSSLFYGIQAIVNRNFKIERGIMFWPVMF